MMRTLVDLGDRKCRRLDELSKKEKRSRAALIRQAIDDYLAKRHSKQESDAFGLLGKHKVDDLAYMGKIMVWLQGSGLCCDYELSQVKPLNCTGVSCNKVPDVSRYWYAIDIAASLNFFGYLV
jgi:predicted transcriptional regulator